jgi:hypothetical protein
MGGFLENLENVMFPEDDQNIQYESSVDQNMIDLLGPSSCECGKCNCQA